MAMTHCSCDSVACSSRDRVGMATFRLELPTVTISRLRHSTARIHQRRDWTVTSVVSGSAVIAAAGDDMGLLGNGAHDQAGRGARRLRCRRDAPRCTGPTTWYSVTFPLQSRKGRSVE